MELDMEDGAWSAGESHETPVIDKELPKKSSKKGGKPRKAAASRDSQESLKKAQERLETAQRVLEQVTVFHEAADAMDEAQRNLTEAQKRRQGALFALRECGLTISAIEELTGMSQSRIQALVKQDLGD